MRGLILFLSLFQAGVAFSQVEDSVVLEFNEFYAIVLANHPMAKQADLLTRQAAQQVRLARGGFDPKIEATYNTKFFNETEYYQKGVVALKVPTWFGITAEGGLRQNEGVYLNPENFLPSDANNSQVFFGASWSLGNGLFIDQRRATLRQAQLFEESNEAERVKMLNKLLLTAAKDYWDWYFAYENYLLFQQSIDIASDIFNRTKVGYEYGEVAAIDTVQAKANLLTRKNEFLEAKVLLRKAALQLSNHLWDEQGQPLELIENAKPETVIMSGIDDNLLDQLVTEARQNHPELRKLQLKGESLAVDNRLAREQIRPQLDLKYHVLDKPITPAGEGNQSNFLSDYQVGVDFAIPILLRKERAKLRMTDIKITDNSLALDFRQRQIINGINASYTEVVNTRLMVDQQAEMADSYRRIVNAERLNLQNGESDLFKLNSQLTKYLEVQSKLIKIRAQFKKTLAELYWAAGVENLGFEG